MTDQTIPADLVERLHNLAGKWATTAPFTMENDVGSTLDQCADELRALLPAPPRPTLADMTPEEREACRWMQGAVSGFADRMVIIEMRPSSVDMMAEDGERWNFVHKRVTPRPDLPRLEWPGTEEVAPAPAPAPALPDGWRLAEHRKYGRVIVTNPTPDVGGHVYFVSPAPSPIGNDWHFCTPDELRYIDTEPEEA